MKQRIIKSAVILLALPLYIFLLFGVGNAKADVGTAIIPVFVKGQKCNVALYDEHGNKMNMQCISGNCQGEFSVSVAGMKTRYYTVKVTDKDDDEIVYDKREYKVAVDLFYDTRGRIYATVTGITETGGKPAQLEFDNKLRSELDPNWNNDNNNADGRGHEEDENGRNGGGTPASVKGLLDYFDVPKTGDSSRVWVLFCVSMTARFGILAVLIMFFINRRKERQNEA